MKILTRLLFATLITSNAFATESSQYFGRDIVEKKISARIFSETSGLSFTPYYGITQVFPPSSLPELLGGVSGFGQVRSFKNGNPNALNFLLYYLAFHQFSNEVKDSCRTSNPKFNEKFRAILESMCEWPSKDAKDPKVLEQFWIAVMGYDAPEEEFQAWSEFFLTSSYAKKPFKITLPAMIQSMLLNPHFLLRK